jgi:hypothetical protein
VNLEAFDSPIGTPRLVVRRVEERDLGGLMDVNGDEAVTRYLPYATWTSSDDASGWLVRMSGLQEAGKARQLVVVDRDDGRVLGAILLFNFDESNRRAEVGYVLAQASWGRGLMRSPRCCRGRSRNSARVASKRSSIRATRLRIACCSRSGFSTKVCCVAAAS